MAFNDTTPILEMLQDGLWRLREALTYTTPEGLKICVPAGFVTDLASVPQLFWNIYPPAGNYAPAAIIHDWLYTCQEVGGDPFAEPPVMGQEVTRAQADSILYQGMQELGVPAIRRSLIYAAVRMGGWLAWNAKTSLGLKL